MRRAKEKIRLNNHLPHKRRYSFRENRPVALVWRGRRRVVAEVLDEWRQLGPLGEQDPSEERFVHRVLTEDGGVYEIDYRTPARQWCLYRVYDCRGISKLLFGFAVKAVTTSRSS